MEKHIRTNRDAVEFYPYNGITTQPKNWDEIYKELVKIGRNLRRRGWKKVDEDATDRKNRTEYRTT
jgi:hypothetical protein